eukprot:291473_1
MAMSYSENAKGYTDSTFYEETQAILRKKLINSNNILKTDIESMDRNGYLILENLIPKQKLSKLKIESEQLLDKRSRTKRHALGTTPLTERAYCIVSHSRCYDDLLLNERVNNILKYYLYRNYLLTVSMIINIKPNEIKQQLHKDNNPFIYGINNNNNNPLIISTMWAITDFNTENGGTIFVPGSHKWCKHRKLRKSDKIISANMKAGSVVVWFGNTIHGGGANVSNSNRMGVLAIYNQPWIRPQDNALLATPFQIVDTMPKQIQTLIGYSLHGSVGTVNGRHPKHGLKEIINWQTSKL